MEGGQHSARSQNGSALFVVLAVVSFLTVTLTTTLIVVQQRLKSVATKSEAFDAYLMAQRGVSFGTHPEVLRDDPLLSFVAQDGLEGYEVKIEGEASRLHINGVILRKDKSLLREMFEFWGLRESDASQLTDALVDWVDGNDVVELEGAEKDQYAEMGYLDRPYNKPFQNLDDMLLVRGFEQAALLNPEWRDWFTLWGDTTLDIQEARVELLALAGEVELDAAEVYRADLMGEDGLIGTEDDRIAENLDLALDELGVSVDEETRDRINKRFRTGSGVRRVVSRGWSGETQKQILMIVRRSKNKPSVLHYKESRLERENAQDEFITN